MTLAAQTTFDEPVDVLNYALTLEHLENAFYRDGLEQFSAEDFTDAGYAEAVHENIIEIGAHEQEHVDTLTSVITDLDGEPVEEGEYDFSAAFADLASFVETAGVLENTGVSAYQGAAQFLIGENALLTAALNIHSVEARHAAYLNGLNGTSPFPAAVDPPLTPDEVVEAVTPFFATDGTSDTADAEATPEA